MKKGNKDIYINSNIFLFKILFLMILYLYKNRDIHKPKF